jgi:hypothetical protein
MVFVLQLINIIREYGQKRFNLKLIIASSAQTYAEKIQQPLSPSNITSTLKDFVGELPVQSQGQPIPPLVMGIFRA